MPNQPPSDRTRAAFRRPELAEGHPSPEFCILASGFSPKMQNEPNFIPRPPRLCKTNPIRPHGHPAHNPNTRNEPNPGTRSVPPPHISAKQTQFSDPRQSRQPKTTKRTQSPTTATLSLLLPPLYFPLSRGHQPPPPNFSRVGPVEDQKIRNEP